MFSLLGRGEAKWAFSLFRERCGRTGCSLFLEGVKQNRVFSLLGRSEAEQGVLSCREG